MAVKMAPWGNSATESVIELLYDSRLAIPPGVIEYNLKSNMRRPPSLSTVNRAVRELFEADLIERCEGTDGYYRITDSGVRVFEAYSRHDNYSSLNEFVDDYLQDASVLEGEDEV